MLAEDDTFQGGHGDVAGATRGALFSARQVIPFDKFIENGVDGAQQANLILEIHDHFGHLVFPFEVSQRGPYQLPGPR